jgi:hypothetical protein
MAKMKDRDYYRLTIPGQLIRSLSDHHPYLVDSDGDIDDLNLVTVVANDWLNSRSSRNSSAGLHEPPYPHILPYSLPYDIDNGPHMADIIKRNPEGVVALYVCPTDLGTGSDFLKNDIARMLAYGAAKNFLGEGSKQVVDRHPKVDCKYFALALQVCDPKFPYRNDLIIGEARTVEFRFLMEGRAEIDFADEGWAAVSALIRYAPEATLMVLDTGGLYREYEKLEKRLTYWTAESLKFYTGIYSHEDKKVRFEY